MNLLFIDANIYLGLFNTNRPEFKKLLASLIELKDQIYISQQIVDEVKRNKLNVFRQSIDNYIKQATLASTLLPEHLDSEKSKSFTEWNKNRKEIEELITKSNVELAGILDEVLKGISLSSDNISQLLETIFLKARRPSSLDILRAKHRREIGNPPGKPNDPLGDQLSWEMLLSALDNVTNLWIVSKDRDYFSEHKERLYLNSLLVQDILGKNPSIKIKLFNKLSEALRDYNTHVQIYSLPDNEVLNKISDVEEQINVRSIYNSAEGLSLKPKNCPSCNSNDSFSNGSYLRSTFGGLTLQYVCGVCGYRLDTGDSFD